MITALVAYDESRVIGYQNGIPWHLPEDLRQFQKRTTGNIIVMGRLTWDSLPKKPLPNRTNIVITRKGIDSKDCLVANSINESIQLATAHCPTHEIFVVGGETIYKAFLETRLIDKVIASEVHGNHQGDAFFPTLTGWGRKLLDSYDEFDVVEYVKKD